ncbi:ABC transporter ATP-binding protein [Flavihumibacter petaseus]|uniref:Putative ABC transporter ATP-binding/permease protein n=1 Tax=Flavihumibacter petaseus NBRC 106054 TaxID=1220578 RepID=A0A0E9MX81_9BACT|nr:ABC transporter ATP-binding protein [Flavihumibacter petaseus]GAO42199.1 putative ABC transporter ATP-binding/permease protein [Flavihumibacter petaseus NBRC 106054]
MRILWKYLRPYQWWVFLALVLAGTAQVLALYDPIIFGKVIDQFALNPGQLSEKERIQGVTWLLVIAVGIALLSRIAVTFKDYVIRLVVQKFGMQVFNDGLRQTLRLPFQGFENQNSGETVSKLQKVRNDTERFINSFINILFSSLVGICFLIWYAVTKHWALIPVFLIGVVVLGGLTSLLSRRIKTIQRSVVKQTNLLSGSITESLRNIELIKSLGLTYPEIRRLRGMTQRIFDLEMDKTKKVRTLSFLQGTTLNLLKQSILFILLWLIFRNVLSTGELISMQFISTGIIGPLQDLGNIILQYREAEASLQVFNELMEQTPEYRPEEPIDVEDITHLKFEHVYFRHSNTRQYAVEDISFEIGLGETIAFVGPSGSGKSTLVKLLVGLYTPVAGDISIDGVSVKHIRYNHVRRQLGFVTQETQLFSGTIRDNMLFVKPDATDDEIMNALGKASCMHLVTQSPRGLDTVLGEGGKRLSGGEKQRLAIARALLREPRLLIFDEATSALDSITEEDISATIRNISEGKRQMTIMIAHRLSTIMHADTIFVLEKGKITEQGKHDQLVEAKGLYYAMWRQQVGERPGAPSSTAPSEIT